VGGPERSSTHGVHAAAERRSNSSSRLARFENGIGSCSLEPDNTEVIDPGSYADVAVKSRSHLKVRSGTYEFNSLSFEPQAVLDIDNTAGPVFIYVRTTFGFSGTVVETKRRMLWTGPVKERLLAAGVCERHKRERMWCREQSVRAELRVLMTT